MENFSKATAAAILVAHQANAKLSWADFLEQTWQQKPELVIQMQSIRAHFALENTTTATERDGEEQKLQI